MLGWDGSRKVVVAPQPKNNHGGLLQNGSNDDASGQFTSAEIDAFSVIDRRGARYTASVEVALDRRPGGGAHVVSGVSIVPDAPPANDGWANGIPWPGLAAVA